jgi:hypothetical protein
MIDRGISENYIIFWIEAAEACGGIPIDHIEKGVEIARRIARRGGQRSLINFYDSAFQYFRNEIVAAEYLRRALQELAEPTPVDDTLPPPESKVWEHIGKVLGYFPGFTYPPPTPPPRLARRPRSSR